MPIFGQNSILNAFVPKFLLRTPLDGQMLVWDSDVDGFVNVSVPNVLNGGMTADQLKQFGIMKLYLESNNVSFSTASVTDLYVTSTGSPNQVFVTFGASTVYQYATVTWGDGSAPTIVTMAQMTAAEFPTHTYQNATPTTISVTLYNPYGLGPASNVSNIPDPGQLQIG